MNKTLACIGGLLVIVAAVFGAFSYLRSEFAPKALAEEVRQFKQQYDYDKTINFLRQTEGRIYVIKERHGEKPDNKTIKEELNKLEKDAEELKDKLKVIEKK